MKHLRDENLVPNIPDPDVPEIGDIVRVYADKDSQFYLIGKVIDYHDDKEFYTVEYMNRGGEEATIKVYPNRVCT